MRFGVPASVVLHAGAIGLAFVSLPESVRTHVESEPYIPIELIANAENAPLTSIPAAAPKPTEEPVEIPDLPDPEPEVIPEPQPEPEQAEPPQTEPEPLPDPEKEKPEPPKEEPKEEPKKPEPPKKDPPKKEPEELDFTKLAGVIDKSKENQTKGATTPSQTPNEAENPQDRIGAGDRLTASDIQKMRAAVSRCWNAGSIIGAPEPEKLQVVVEFELNRDGTLMSQVRVKNAMQINMSGNRFWKAAEQNAVRAVIGCQPYDFLAVDRYEDWKEMELNFDPSQMAGM
jgi:hypothetical protein